jgi:hypothetical protein
MSEDEIVKEFERRVKALDARLSGGRPGQHFEFHGSGYRVRRFDNVSYYQGSGAR